MSLKVFHYHQILFFYITLLQSFPLLLKHGAILVRNAIVAKLSLESAQVFFGEKMLLEGKVGTLSPSCNPMIHNDLNGWKISLNFALGTM